MWLPTRKMNKVVDINKLNPKFKDQEAFNGGGTAGEPSTRGSGEQLRYPGCHVQLANFTARV
jgi:hypothetical protein